MREPEWTPVLSTACGNGHEKTPQQNVELYSFTSVSWSFLELSHSDQEGHRDPKQEMRLMKR